MATQKTAPVKKTVPSSTNIGRTVVTGQVPPGSDPLHVTTAVMKKVKEVATPKASGKYHIEYWKSSQKSNKQPWGWRMKEENTQIVATAGEGYASRAVVETQLRQLHGGLGLAIPVVEIDYDSCEIKKTLIAGG